MRKKKEEEKEEQAEEKKKKKSITRAFLAMVGWLVGSETDRQTCRQT